MSESDDAVTLAQKAAGGAVERVSDRLPYLFAAGTTKVLVHRGAVVTGRGPVVAGAYLRDLGVVNGGGPPIADILVLLDALDALPDVPGVDKRAYVTGNPNLEPYVYGDGSLGQVVLHYFTGGAPNVQIDHDPTHVKRVGSMGPAAAPYTPKATARMTLEIPKQGDSRWKREDINT